MFHPFLGGRGGGILPSNYTTSLSGTRFVNFKQFDTLFLLLIVAIDVQVEEMRISERDFHFLVYSILQELNAIYL